VESLGDKLREAREEKSLSISYISQETNISSRYLEALEKEDFAQFPGEPYILGFLKNYGTYLELDVNELLSLYRSFKIQEEPVPVEQLLRSPSKAPKYLIILAIILAGLAIIGGGVYFFLTNFTRPLIDAPLSHSPVEYTMSTNVLERRFYQGDTIIVPFGDNNYKIEVSGIGETVMFTTPIDNVRLDLNQDALVDLGGNGFAEILITVSDFARNNNASGALVRFELQSFPVAETIIYSDDEEIVLGTAQEPIVIITSPNPYPFTLQAMFLRYCLFRWEILFEPARAGRNEQYFQPNDELSVQAQNGMRLGISNAQAVRLQVIGGGRTYTIEAGGPGEIVVADLRWLRDDDNRFHLVLSRLE